MKKLAFFSLALALSGTMAYAQKQCDCTFLPEAGDFALEIQVNPFANSFNSFQLNGATIQGKYFLDDKNALRFNVGLTVNNSKSGYTGYEPIRQSFSDDLTYQRALAEYNLQSKDFAFTSTGNLIINAGYERHFPVAKRLDAYVGGQLGIDWKWSSYKSETNCYDDWASATSASFKNSWKNTTSKSGIGATFAFAAAAVAGADFYIYKGLFLGAELGLGLKATTNCNGKETQTTGDPTVAEDLRSATRKYTNNGSAFAVSCYAIKALRIGWKF